MTIKDQVQRAIELTRRPVKATIMSIEIDKVSIQFGGSANLMRHVEVIGDAGTLTIGQEVSIIWRDLRPVAILSGAGNITATTVEVAEDHHLNHMNAGPDEINVNGLSGVLADPQNANQINGILVSGTPTNGQTFAYNASTGHFEPTAVSGASVAHASSHDNGGNDEIDVTGLSGLLAEPQTPASHFHNYILAYVYNEDHTAECNGSRTTFYTGNQFISQSCRVYLNGLRLRRGTQYNEGVLNDLIEMVTPPTAGQVLIFDMEV
jgi:hypothetical protein